MKIEKITFMLGRHEDKPTFSILIPTWNSLQYLKLCIGSIRKNSRFNHQIIVHVNEGSDGSYEWVKTQMFDHSYSHSNAGVCYAFNAAATLAKSPGGWSDAVYSMPGPDRVSRDQSFVDLSGSCMHDRPGGFTGT